MEKFLNADLGFIDDVISSDLENNSDLRIHTRFPPEPNGCLHIGSVKAIWIDYSAAKKNGGQFNLRFDDTNPTKENEDYVKSIYEDLVWLGAKPDNVFYGSDYFEQCYQYAVKLIKDGKAYVDDLTPEEMREYRGTLNKPGVESPYRNRSIEENLELFEKMKNGEFADATKTLRAKIDMSSPNLNLRDPVLYRIFHTSHHKQGDKWCIYPMYDFAHPIQDAIEGITHSLCSIEFENHRPLYNWVIDNIGVEKKPHQYEFARLNLTHVVMSKRYLRQLVESGLVDGWDDPRMPTLMGLRRRGYTPQSLFEFVQRVGVSKNYGVVDMGLLEYCIREELNKTAPRRIAIKEPIKVKITNLPDEHYEEFEMPNNNTDENAGTRKVPFTNELYIDSEDFFEIAPPKFHRLTLNGEVRLMGAYVIKCNKVVKKEDGSIDYLECTCDLVTKNGNTFDGRKIKGTIQWLSASNVIQRKLAFYDYLFSIEDVTEIPEDKGYDDYLNKNSVTIYKNALVEANLKDDNGENRYQFVRMGYFIKDSKNPDTYICIVGLKDNYKK